MIDQTPPVLPAPAIEAETQDHLMIEQRAGGNLVIDLLQLTPPRQDCTEREADPFHPEIVVCGERYASPRLGGNSLAEVDDFGNAIPRARWKLSEKAALEANGTNQSIGGWNANGGEVRLKIGF